MRFDAAEAGTSVEAWADDPRLADLPQLDLDGVERLVVVAAHPDDETLGAGGLISRLAGRGIPIDVVVVTDGRASHPSSVSHSPEQLAAMRRAETLNAISSLSADANVVFLDVPDGESSDSHQLIVDGIGRVIGDAAGVLIAAPLRTDGHRDHRAVGHAASAAARAVGARLIEYPIWMWHWGDPHSTEIPWPRMSALQLDEREVAAKNNAIAAHRSQVRGVSEAPGDGPVLRADFVAHFQTGAETFVGGHGSLSQGYFDDLYERRADPWSFETRWYEQRKRAITLASLPDVRFSAALELGCSIGTLTEQLAAACTALLAVDISDRALEQARRRLAPFDNVTFERVDFAQSFPAGDFDLIVLSEVGYYLDDGALEELVEHIRLALRAGGTLVACHWRHPVADYPLSGDHVHDVIRRLSGLHRIVSHIEDDFILEVFSADVRSVAGRTGLL